MLDSTDAKVSHSRFLAILTVLTVLYTWSWVSLYLRSIQDIPAGVYAFVGIVVAGTVGNKAFDRVQGSSSTETITKTVVDNEPKS